MHRSIILVAAAALIHSSLMAEAFIRINQLGYLPRSAKIAVLMSDDTSFHPSSWELRDALTGETVWTSTVAVRDLASGAFTNVLRLDFSRFTLPGAYFIAAGEVRSAPFPIREDVYTGTADFLLRYMRQQRSGFNPFLRDSCHTHDGYIIYHPKLDSTFIDVVGGWHDAADYLQYVTTSATAVFQMLFAFETNPSCFGDSYLASGLPGANGIPDILDEAKWGLDWLVKMNPAPGVMFNQIADDRDHAGFRLPSEDTTSYGMGRERPVYFCTGKPQGLFAYKNRATGIASTAGKFASSFALGALVLGKYYPGFAPLLRTKAVEAYAWGKANLGVCQTAPCRAPYFYEEDNSVDDMELAATQLYRLTGEAAYMEDAFRYGREEPVVPWMGTNGARHYQWYPFVNLGHYYIALQEKKSGTHEAASWLKEGIERVRERGERRPFRFGVPFIWCSNNLVSSMLAHLRAYAAVTGDSSYAGVEGTLRDWLFGCNPWGTSMIVGLPKEGICPRDPHSAFSHLHGYPVDGGLVDGPVRRAIFSSLKGVELSREDPFRAFQSDSCVYHDDWADYSTNEPTMDGTAGLTYYLASMQSEGAREDRVRNVTMDRGAVTRMDSTRREIYMVFTGHEFSDGGKIIRSTLKKRNVKASFFFTGDFYRNDGNAALIGALLKDGHYLGPHSDRHLLYASWENRDSLLVTKQQFMDDLRENYRAMGAREITKKAAGVFLPPFEWHNAQIASWCREAGVKLVNFTPGTRSNADYTVPGGNYVSSDRILKSILIFESMHSGGLNGFILLMHVGTDPRRTDKFYRLLEGMIAELKRRGYTFRSFGV